MLPKRFAWSGLPRQFRRDADAYLSWAGGSDPFDSDARLRPLAPQTIRLRRDQIHAAVTALANSGTNPHTLRSLADLVRPDNLKSILRRRLAIVEGRDNVFNHLLARVLFQIAREWVKVDPKALADIKWLVHKVPGAAPGPHQ